MIAGTIRNAVKLDMLSKNWEQKKASGNVLSKQERNERANWTPEQRQINMFQEQMEQDRENSKMTELANKVMYGDDLTPDEEQYLASHNPGLLSNYRQAKAEAKAYEEKLRQCKTKDDVQRLKTNTINGYMSEMSAAKKTGSKDAVTATAFKLLAKVKNIEHVEREFIESGEYALLPTDADKQQERAKETAEDNERMFEEVLESAEDDESEVEDKEKPDDPLIDVGKPDMVKGDEEMDPTDEAAKKAAFEEKEGVDLPEKKYKPEVKEFEDIVDTLKRDVPEVAAFDNRREAIRKKKQEVGGTIDVAL